MKKFSRENVEIYFGDKKADILFWHDKAADAWISLDDLDYDDEVALVVAVTDAGYSFPIWVTEDGKVYRVLDQKKSCHIYMKYKETPKNYLIVYYDHSFRKYDSYRYTDTVEGIKEHFSTEPMEDLCVIIDPDTLERVYNKGVNT